MHTAGPTGYLPVEKVWFSIIVIGKKRLAPGKTVPNPAEIHSIHFIMTEKKVDRQGAVATKEWVEVQEPPLYKVLLHNDDYTSMEFVVQILEVIFHKSTQEATRIMLNVHEKGIGVAGVYTREICETKIAVVHELARKNEFPLRCSMERV